MSSIRTFRDTFCRRKHQYIVHAWENQRIESLLSRSSNSIIKEYVLFEENIMREVSDMQLSIEKKCDDDDLTNHVSTSKTMLRIFVWRAARIFRFESNSWIAFFLFRRKAWDETTNVLIDDFVNQVRFRIELFEFFLCYSCARFSLWSVYFIDIKEFETTHFICSFHRRKRIRISSSIRTMIVLWNLHRQNVERFLYFARDLTLIISITQEMTSEQRYLKQREWVDFCVRRQNLLQRTMKRIWTWIKNDCLWQKFHKIFEEFEENYFDLIFIVRQTRDMKRMTKETMSHIAIIWEFNSRVFKSLDLHTLRFMKKCARIDYTMIEILRLIKKIVIYRLHHSKKEVFKKILSTATNWTRIVDEFRMQESISEDALKAFNLKDERSFLSKEKEQSIFTHINFEISSKIIQNLIKVLMNETQQLLFTLKSTPTKLVRDSRQDAIQSDLNDATQTDLNGQTQPDLNGQTTQPDPNGQTQPDLNGQTQPDFNGQTQPDPNGQTQPDLNGQIQPDLNDQTTQPDLNGQTTQPDLNGQTTQSDLNDQIQLDLNDQTQSDFNTQNQFDLNDTTQSDSNTQNQFDSNRQQQTRNKRRRRDSDERNDCDCRESDDIWKRNLEKHDDNTHDEKKALLLLSSIIYAKWTLCDVHQSILRRTFKLIEHDLRRVITIRLNCIWNARWNVVELRTRNSQWFQQNWERKINDHRWEFLCLLKSID